MSHLRIQIPVLDESATIARVIDDVLRSADGLVAQSAIARVSVLVIDDGSTDATPRILSSIRDPRVRVLRHAETRGVGAAFRSGVVDALDDSCDLLLHIDGDGQFDAAELPLLVAPVLAGRIDLALGSRFRSGDPPRMPWTKRWGNFVVARLVSALARVRLDDVSCGFRCYSRRALATMRLSADFTYTHESILSCAARGLRILEVPINALGERAYGQSRVARSLVRYGVCALAIIVRAVLRERRSDADERLPPVDRCRAPARRDEGPPRALDAPAPRSQTV